LSDEPESISDLEDRFLTALATYKHKSRAYDFQKPRAKVQSALMGLCIARDELVFSDKDFDEDWEAKKHELVEEDC